MRWLVVSGCCDVVFDTFVRDHVEVFPAVVCPGEAVWDVGALKGSVTLALSQLVGC